MKIMNTSHLPDALVRAVVRFAVREREVEKFVRTVKVMSLRRGAWKGRCGSSGTVKIWVGQPASYPIVEHQYRAGAPIYSASDPVEGLAAILGHEFQHGRQFLGQVKRHSEVDAEFGAIRVLTAFREKRAEIEAAASARQAKVDGSRAERQAAYVASAPAAQIARLEAKVREWTTREKRATTIRKKWEKRLARARLAVQS